MKEGIIFQGVKTCLSLQSSNIFFFFFLGGGGGGFRSLVTSGDKQTTN